MASFMGGDLWHLHATGINKIILHRAPEILNCYVKNRQTNKISLSLKSVFKTPKHINSYIK